MSITVVFDPPLPSDSPSVFNTKAFALLGDLNDWSAEANALAVEVTADEAALAVATASATASASAASTSASTATTQASSATASASSATTSASTATTKASEANASAVAAAASAAVINLTAPGPIGSVTASTGRFTTLTSTGNATLGDAEASDAHAIKGVTTLLANSASAALTVTQTGSGNAFVVEDSTTPDNTAFVIDGSGNAIVGNTVPYTISGATAKHLQSSSTSGAAGFTSTLWSSGAAGSAPALSMLKSRGAAQGSYLVCASGDTLGAINFAGDDEAKFLSAASIQAQVDGTPGLNDMPGRLVFSTTADNQSTPTERMRIDSAGLVTLAQGQIKFPATQNASADANTLDDYREESWTATATGMTTAPTGVVTFVRVGNVVQMNIPTISGTSNATTFTLTGMPTTCRPTALRYIPIRVQDNGGTVTYGMAVISAAGVFELFLTPNQTAFTASGAKAVYTTAISYPI